MGSGAAPLVRSAKHDRTAWTEIRMRPGTMRRMYGPDGRQGSEVLQPSNQAGSRSRDHNDRRIRFAGQAKSIAGCFHSGTSGSMRLLHQWNGHGKRVAAPPDAASNHRTSETGTRPESVPLRNPHAHSRRRAAHGQGLGGTDEKTRFSPNQW